MEIIRVNNLVKRYRKIEALKGIDFSVNSGEIFGYIGPNGSGKTTTIRILTGLCRPNGGSVYIQNIDVLHNYNQLSSLIGVVFEDNGLYLPITAWENLEFFARLVGLSSSERHSRINEVLKLVELEERAHSIVKTYSKGMLRRLAIARAILLQPDILFLDEPFDGVDIATRHVLINMLRKWIEEPNHCIFLTSHNMADIEALCSRLAIIHTGKIVAIDTINALRTKNITGQRIEIMLTELIESDRIREVLSKIPQINDFHLEGLKLVIKTHAHGINAEIALQLLNAGIKFEDIRTENESLEELYLRMVANR
ncbi:MAG: ABC transporter ATP-binding protein [Firmicutes bacterium]|nr:ABC transporter ATP-binding protein [Bacillota bacterium]